MKLKSTNPCLKRPPQHGWHICNLLTELSMMCTLFGDIMLSSWYSSTACTLYSTQFLNSISRCMLVCVPCMCIIFRHTDVTNIAYEGSVTKKGYFNDIINFHHVDALLYVPCNASYKMWIDRTSLYKIFVTWER